MKYLSVCSGIEAASVAWHGLGWEPVGFSEIEKFPSQVLATRFPGVKNYGDMTRFKEWDIERGAIDVLVGGTPCQAFSVAGLRKGLSDPRGNLALTFVAMVDHYRPEWVVWENVPGVLSSSGGRDFGAFLGALGELGYGFAYRVLDAQYFGVAQRRRRVFVVAHSSGDARRAAEVLFEPSCLRGDPPPRREAGQGIAGDASARVGKHGQDDASGTMKWPVEVAPTLNTLYGTKMGLEDQHAFGGAGLFVPVISASNSQEHAAITVDFVSTLTALHEQPYIAVPQTLDQDVCGTITAGFGKLGAPEVDAYTAIPVAMTPEQATDRQTFTASIGDFKEDEVAKTILRNTGAGGETQNPAWVIEPAVYESRPNDSRVTGPVEQSPTVAAKWGTGGNNTQLVQQPYRKSRRAQSIDDYETWVDDGVANTVNCFDQGDIRTTHAVAVQQPIGFYPTGGTHGVSASSDLSPSVKVGSGTGANPPGVAVQQPMAFYPTGGSHGVDASVDVSPAIKVGSGIGIPSPPGVVQPMAFSWQCRGDMRGVDPRPTAQLQRCQIEGVIQPIGLDEEQNARVDGFGCLKARTEGGGFEGAVMTQQMAVRRLTPVECERLQGFPDGWTDIRPKGKDTPDSPRYKALGNSMAVPVMRWIGERIHNAG